MSHNEKIPVALLLLNITIVLGLIVAFVLAKPLQNTSSNTELNVLGVETYEDVQKEFTYLNLCTKDVCQSIPPDVTASFYEGDLLKEDAVEIYIQGNIVPFFENYYGGKEVVSNSNGQFKTWIKDIRPDLSAIAEDVVNVLRKREEGEDIREYDIPVKRLPGTDGTYASRYMEVDNSSQKLYVWMDGKVTRVITLSGPVYGYQVYGVFPIVDKGLSPVAPGGKYMPYWMAFYYSKRQDSWYGLHALIWWYDDNGKKIYESTANIGTRQSAGCIRMLLADAKYLYENFEKGDILLIHE